MSAQILKCRILLAIGLFFSTILFAQEKAAKASAAPKEKLPSPKEIVDKFLKVSGGRDKFLKIKSQHVLGKFEIAAQGINGKLEIFAAAPNKMRISINIPGLGEVVSGYDGKVAWAINPATGPMVHEDKVKQELADQADFYGFMHDPKDYKSMETMGIEEFEGERCYQVKFVKKNGKETLEYFSLKTGYLVGVAGKQETELGSVEVNTFLSDYKPHGEIIMASKIRQKFAVIEQTITLEKMEFNQVPESAFDLPTEIKALVEK